jgi:hypothetical protein
MKKHAGKGQEVQQTKQWGTGYFISSFCEGRSEYAIWGVDESDLL